jgi:di/tricarboxylate transporter
MAQRAELYMIFNAAVVLIAIALGFLANYARLAEARLVASTSVYRGGGTDWTLAIIAVGAMLLLFVAWVVERRSLVDVTAKTPRKKI